MYATKGGLGEGVTHKPATWSLEKGSDALRPSRDVWGGMCDGCFNHPDAFPAPVAVGFEELYLPDLG